MVNGFADEMTVKSAKFMQIIKEMEAKADADKTKMQELQNKVNDLMKYDNKFSHRSREDGLLIDRLNNEKADLEDQNLDLQYRLEDMEKFYNALMKNYEG